MLSELIIVHDNLHCIIQSGLVDASFDGAQSLIYHTNCIGFQTIYLFQCNKKVKARPRPFYCCEISKLSEILYNL